MKKLAVWPRQNNLRFYMTKIIFFFLPFLLLSLVPGNLSFAAIEPTSKEESKMIKELDSEGFKLDNTSLIVLNSYAKKNNIAEGESYRLTYSCTHKNKIEKCRISGLAFKKKMENKE
jgi:hypothetical protein